MAAIALSLPVVLQLVGAGVGLHLAVTHIGHWIRRRNPTWSVWFGAAAAAMSAVLVTNTAVVHGAGATLLFARTLALSAALLFLFLALLTFTGQRAPRLLAVLGTLMVLRIALWVGTDAVFAHRFDADGLPVYGPFVGLSAAPILGVIVVSAVVFANRLRTSAERATLLIGAVAAGALATATFAVSDKWLAELLTGCWTLPELALLQTAVMQRRVRMHDHTVRTNRAQQAVAELAEAAVAERRTSRLLERGREIVAAVLDVPAHTVQFDPEGRSVEITDATTLRGGDRQFLATAAHVVGAAADRINVEQRLSYWALHDALTELPNRAMLRAGLDAALAEGRQGGDAPAVLFCGLDNFKRLNDVRGHQAGDDVLVEVGRRLRQAVTEPDLACRFGGAEFVVLTTASSVDRIAGAVQEAVRFPVPTVDGTRDLTMSVGVAIARPRDSADDVLRDADIAMYEAKATGGQRVVTFAPALRAELLERLHTEEALAGAVAAGEIEVHYQPVVELATGRVTSVEALARWRRDGTLRAPDSWIECAERTGAILGIGEHVLRTACRDAARLPDDITIAVNVSARQLSPSFASVVDGALAGGLDPTRLTLELTESVLAEDPTIVANLLASLRRRGIRIAIDDFGTGFSSLSQLVSLPIDVLKIDRSFVRRLDTADGVAVTEAIVGLAKVLDLDTVAEGIEQPADAGLLRAIGCRFGQGYLFGRPAPLATVVDAARRQHWAHQPTTR